jgi:hypothetical protein
MLPRLVAAMSTLCGSEETPQHAGLALLYLCRQPASLPAFTETLVGQLIQVALSSPRYRCV